MKKAFIFDFDGVLVDFKKRYYSVYRDSMSGVIKREPSMEEIIYLRQKNGSAKIFDKFIEEEEISKDRLNEMIKKRNKFFEDIDYLKLDQLNKEAMEINNNLKKIGWFSAIVTRRKNFETFEKQINLLNIRNNFDFMINCDEKSKAIKKIIEVNGPFEKIFFLTDTVEDVLDLKNLPEVLTIAYPGSFDDYESLKKSEPYKVIKSIGELNKIL